MTDPLENIDKVTKRGFEPGARLRNRGLRKASIILFLDEELGPELGWAEDTYDALGNVNGHIREGVIGELERVTDERDETLTRARVEASQVPEADAAQAEELIKSIEEMYREPVAELEAKRDKLIAELTRTGFTLQLRAVPPVIQKDQHRRAKDYLEINEKGVPEDRAEEVSRIEQGFLMSVMIQSITDNESGEVNTETTLQDALDFMDFLPPGQQKRLDAKLGMLQFTDAISRSIEGQEDFS